MRSARLAAFAAACIAAAAQPSAAATWVVSDSGQGDVVLDVGATGAAELSGLAWIDGASYVAVSDNGGELYALDIVVDPATGALGATATSSASVATGTVDGEGIAYRAATASVFVSDETGAAIREYALSGGPALSVVSVPPVFSSAVSNRSLESLSASDDFAALWTANEEALAVDGPGPTEEAGTVVRLQRFDASLAPTGQWAYRTDPLAAQSAARHPRLAVPYGGVSELVALPDGELLVLERSLGASGLRIRLYQAELEAATDTSSFAALDGETYAPASKRLLWESSGFSNFEGAALGRALEQDGRSLVLVADNSSFGSTALRGLRIDRVCTPLPREGCSTAGSSKFSARVRGGDRDRLGWRWRKGSFDEIAALGDPRIAGQAGYGLCVYADDGGTPALRMEAALPSGQPWKAAGTSGFKYRRRAGDPDGIGNALPKAGGDERASVKVVGKGAALGFTAGAPEAPFIETDGAAIVQMARIGGPVGSCFEAVYETIDRNTPDRFQARY